MPKSPKAESQFKSAEGSRAARSAYSAESSTSNPRNINPLFEIDEDAEKEKERKIKECLEETKEDIKKVYFERFATSLQAIQIEILFSKMCLDLSSFNIGKAEQLRAKFFDKVASMHFIIVGDELKRINDKFNDDQVQTLERIYINQISTEDIQDAANSAMKELKDIFLHKKITEIFDMKGATDSDDYNSDDQEDEDDDEGDSDDFFNFQVKK